MNEKFRNMMNGDSGLYGEDFLLTWEKSGEQIENLLIIADTVKKLRDNNVSVKCFDSGLAISIFRDNSTRTRFSFASAANLLGLEIQDLDEKKSQIAHGETVRETANMISFLAETIGIRDDIFLGEGDKYMRSFGEALDDGFRNGILPVRPGIVNLQSDLDHPTQSLADLLHLKNHFGSLESLKGKKIAMTWAYSPSYGKPLSVPQGIIGLMSRFGMDVTLAYPEGYDLIPDIEKLAADNASRSGGSFKIVGSMEEAFKGADIVYPKSWAPLSVMKQRTKLLKEGNTGAQKELENSSLENNKKFINWECNEDRMKLTKGGNALYMHCLPADISGVSCEKGEVSAEVFEKYRIETYREAGFKPYTIAAMIMANRFRDPVGLLKDIETKRLNRIREFNK